MLEIQKLEAGYGELQVLRGIDLRVKIGEIVALIGPNGAGKSTVLKSIFSITNKTSGRILFHKHNITNLKTHELIAEGISYVPQGRINFSTLTIQENLEIGGVLLRSRPLLEERIENVYGLFPFLKARTNDLAQTLSGGQQQLLAIARALVQEPKLLLLDEPSLGLSPIAMKEVFSHIQKLRDEEDISILMVEQNAKKAIEIADRTYLLEDGKIVLEGGKEIIKKPIIKHVYLGGR